MSGCDFCGFILTLIDCNIEIVVEIEKKDLTL